MLLSVPCLLLRTLELKYVEIDVSKGDMVHSDPALAFTDLLNQFASVDELIHWSSLPATGEDKILEGVVCASSDSEEKLKATRPPNRFKINTLHLQWPDITSIRLLQRTVALGGVQHLIIVSKEPSIPPRYLA